MARTVKQIWASVPEIECKGLCQESCGPISMCRSEALQIEERLGGPFGLVDKELRCPLLTPEGRCSIYDIRPLICRLWGVDKALRCPHGCRPTRWVKQKEGRRLIREMERVGGHPVTTIQPALLRRVLGMEQ